MPTEAPLVQAKAEQSRKAKRATLDILRGKKPRREEFTAPIGTDDERVSFEYVAIGAKEYDAMLTKHPPTNEQRIAGAQFNMDTFAPVLLSRVCRDPALSAEEWKEIWTSDSWGRGELVDIFYKAVNLCSREIDAAPIDAD
jgi:hypothetical protein